MCTIAIIGGSEVNSLQKVAQKRGIEILFHDGKMSQRTDKYEGMVRKADVVTLIVDALNHNSMKTARDLAKKHNKPLVFSRGRGLSMALYLSLTAFDNLKEAK
ncbi:MAG: DUF2325 domain-containing protein [Bacillota bacterium]|nr:DUF2325 domain-containing protein [Bacillota bacterium]